MQDWGKRTSHCLLFFLIFAHTVVVSMCFCGNNMRCMHDHIMVHHYICLDQITFEAIIFRNIMHSLPPFLSFPVFLSLCWLTVLCIHSSVSFGVSALPACRLSIAFTPLHDCNWSEYKAGRSVLHHRATHTDTDTPWYICTTLAVVSLYAW